MREIGLIEGANLESPTTMSIEPLVEADVRRSAWSKAARLMLTLGSAMLLIGAATPEQRFEVTLSPGLTDDASGRLLLFAEPATAETTSDAVDLKPGADVWIAARDVSRFGAGHSVTIDTRKDAFPKSFAMLTPGTYRVQAVLDRNGDYNFAGRGPVTSYPRSSR